MLISMGCTEIVVIAMGGAEKKSRAVHVLLGFLPPRREECHGSEARLTGAGIQPPTFPNFLCNLGQRTGFLSEVSGSGILL